VTKKRYIRFFVMLGLTMNTIEAFEYDLIFRMFPLVNPNLI